VSHLLPRLLHLLRPHRHHDPRAWPSRFCRHARINDNDRIHHLRKRSQHTGQNENIWGDIYQIRQSQMRHIEGGTDLILSSGKGVSRGRREQRVEAALGEDVGGEAGGGVGNAR
jgi:hypothetical protein